ncbi:hypothetical protein V3C99_014987 [Haemonchus contortus]
MERVVENPNDLSLEDRRPSRVTTSQMNTNHAYDSAMSDGITTTQQTLIASTSGTNETTSASSAHESALPKGKRATWSESELGKLANLFERHRTANGGVQWAELGSAWESLRSTQDPKSTVSALKAAYAKLSKQIRQANHSADSDGLADLRTSSIPSCPQVGKPREAHANQQNEDLGNKVSRPQSISDGRSSPTQGTESPLGLRIISSRGDRPQGGGTTETPESQPIEALPQRNRNGWTECELGRLANLVERHRTAKGGVQWAELGSAWESLRSTQDPKRTVSALKAAYAKLSKRIRQTDHTADSDGLADLGIPSTQSCPQADSQTGAHSRSPSSRRRNYNLRRSKRSLGGSEMFGLKVNWVDWRTWSKDTGQTNGGVQWVELGSAWESSRNTQDPKRTVKALQAAYAKLAERTERAESIAASEDPAERRTPSRNSCPQQGSEITVLESQQDGGEENPGHQVFGEVASLQYNIESSEGTAEIENQSPEGNSQELPLDGTREPQPNDDPVTMESRTRSRRRTRRTSRRRRDAVELVHLSSDDVLLTRNWTEALEIQQERGAVIPIFPQQSLQSRRSPIRENGDDPQNRRVQRTKDVIWTTNELAKLAFMVERHRDPDGRIRWADLRSTWDCSRMENDPRRTLSALKAAYATIAGLTDRNEASRSEASNNEHEDEEQPAESNIGEPVTLVNQEHTSLSDGSEAGDSTETLQQRLRERFNRYHRMAIDSKDRQPIRRPREEIPDGVLQLGNRGAPTKQYEIAKLHRVTTTAQVQRLLIRFKDELKIVTSDVETKQQALRRLRERQRGYPAVAREPREKESDVPVAEVREHWKAIIGETQPFHPSDALNEWAREQQTDSRDVGDLSGETWAKIFSKIKPWKATGPDGIQGFWWKKLPEAKERLKAWCLEALCKPHRIIPNWVCRGKIVLIPKGNSEARGPGDFRPIACLNTCYKVLTAMIAQQILQSGRDVLPREQVALRKGVWGCTHAHILDQTICKDALRRKNTLHTLWLDMTKAFDSVSHGAIK